MNALSAGAVLQARYASFQQKKQCNDASIENTVSSDTTNKTSIELPQEIKALITGNDFWVNAKSNRYKKLIREGHLDKLLHLAKQALTKDNPANWFARACSKARWEKYTLPYFAKLKEVVRALLGFGKCDFGGCFQFSTVPLIVQLPNSYPEPR